MYDKRLDGLLMRPDVVQETETDNCAADEPTVLFLERLQHGGDDRRLENESSSRNRADGAVT